MCYMRPEIMIGNNQRIKIYLVLNTMTTNDFSNIINIHISRIQGYLLVKIALRFLSRIPKIYVDPRGIAWGVPP